MGLEPLPAKPEDRLITVNTIKVPAGVDWAAVVKNAMDKYQVSQSVGESVIIAALMAGWQINARLSGWSRAGWSRLRRLVSQRVTLGTPTAEVSWKEYQCAVYLYEAPPLFAPSRLRLASRRCEVFCCLLHSVPSYDLQAYENEVNSG